MDKKIITDKLEALRRCVSRVEEKRPADVSELKENVDLQDIISVNLERAVQVSVDIGSHLIAESNNPAPATMGETFDVLKDMNILDSKIAAQMKKAVGFRSIAVHNYQSMDWEIVFNICHKQLDDFKEFAKRIHDQISDSD